MQLENKFVGVTGGGTGIGKAICKALAAEGACIAVTDVNLDWAQAVADEIKAAGHQALALQLDVTVRSQIGQVVNQLATSWGRIDVWCNNAGVSTMRRFVDLTDEDWDYNMNINARGPFLCSQVVARQMMQQSPDPHSGLRGKIVNTASMAGKRGNAPFLVHYVASKFAVVGLTQATAGELAPHGITVNAVCPGYVRTNMQDREAGWEAELRDISADEVRQLYINDTPLRRLETPEDVAGTVLFLASPASDFITGEAIHVNGGSFMD